MSDDVPKTNSAENPPAESKPFGAWQPFTPQGLIAFANAPVARVLFLQLITALLAVAVIIWFLNANYAPSISEAIQNLPDEAALQSGQLVKVDSEILTQNKFLAFVIDLEETGQSGQISDLQVELRPHYFQICSLLGCGLFVYPKETFPIGRSTAEPWWGSRQPIILALCGATAFVQIWLSWIILAAFYASLAKLVAYFYDRELCWSGSWRLVCAAQIPGALLMALCIFLYGIQAFDLIRFLFFFLLHFVVAWIYIAVALYFLPRVSGKIPVAENPFE